VTEPQEMYLTTRFVFFREKLGAFLRHGHYTQQPTERRIEVMTHL